MIMESPSPHLMKYTLTTFQKANHHPEYVMPLLQIQFTQMGLYIAFSLYTMVHITSYEV